MLRTSVKVWTGLGLLTSLVFAAGQAEGSPIRSYRLHEAKVHEAAVSSSSSRLTWQQFLNGGAGLWSRTHAPQFPSGIHLASVNGRLVETQFVDYLLWRRSLNPIRFDAYHPNISGPLAQLLVPPVTPTTTNPQPQTVVPEPGTLMIALVSFGSGFAWLQRSRRTVERRRNGVGERAAG